MILWILLVLLFIAFTASIPVYPHSRRWGYYPSGGLLVLLLILFLLWCFSWMPMWGHYPGWR